VLLGSAMKSPYATTFLKTFANNID